MALRVHGTLDDARLGEIAGLVRDHTTTERLFSTVDALGLAVHDILPMDEYTIDIVVGLPGGAFLVYDTT